jgi:uroporphyrinogen decarboxylase-like protein
MTSRERFAETMRFGRPDRAPYFEEGIRDEVLEQWYEQGLERGADLAERFGGDRWERMPVELRPQPELKERPTTRCGLRGLIERLDAHRADRLPEDWANRVAAWRTREHVLQLPVARGFFQSLGVHDWAGLTEALYLLHDDPQLVMDVMGAWSAFWMRLAERVLGDVQVDFATFSEPVASPAGSLISPQTYDRFVLPHYLPVMDTLRRHGVKTIIFVTFGNARVLLPSVLDAGFDGVWAVEAATGEMDYRALRRQFGRRLRLIGGIDLRTLLTDKDTIRREIEAKVPPLLAQGGYVPMADGRVRENVPLENYVHYRELLEEVTSKAGCRTGSS